MQTIARCLACFCSLFLLSPPRFLTFLAVFAVSSSLPVYAQAPRLSWTRQYIHFGGGASDLGLAIATDLVGNVIAAGRSDDGFNPSAGIVVKYSAAGVPLWTNRIQALTNQYEYSAGVATDAAGNVFVIQSSQSAAEGDDFVTIAFSPNGAPFWTNRYDGPGQGSDLAIGLAVDGSGNVIVSGTSVGANGFPDFATIKYSGAGVPLWTNRFDGAASEYDAVSAVAVDGAGNVLVTGWAVDAAFNTVMTTVKYSAAGAQLWTRSYGGPLGYAFAKGLAVDSAGNVLVTGEAPHDFGQRIATLKYSSAGVPLWTNLFSTSGASYDYPNAIATDGGGNVLVAAAFDHPTGFDTEFGVVKLSSNGALLWTRTLGEPDLPDSATKVATDAAGNVFVSGVTYEPVQPGAGFELATTVSYTSTGAARWTNSVRGTASAQAMDVSGNIAVVGGLATTDIGTGFDYDMLTAKISGAGALLWTNLLDLPGKGFGQTVAIATDAAANIVVAGNSSDKTTGVDFALVKYSRLGQPLWTNRFDGPAHGDDSVRGMAIDSQGNVIIAGESQGATLDITTIKYSAAGVPLWTNHLDGPLGEFEEAAAVVVDSADNIIVTGYTADFVSEWDYLTVKYSPAGVPLWTNLFKGRTTSIDFGQAVATDSAGNVFVTGWTAAANNFFDFGTVKYSAAGVPLWTNRYNGPGNENDQAVAIAVAPNGNIIVTGYSQGVGTSFDFATVAYANSGTPLWTNRLHGGATTTNDQPVGLVIDANDRVFVTGFSVSENAGMDFLTVAYAANGAPLWTNRFNGPANGPSSVRIDRAHDIALDASGNVIVSGFSKSADTPPGIGDLATIAYAPATGAPLWTNRYAYDRFIGAAFSSLATDMRGGIIFTAGEFVTVKHDTRAELFIHPAAPGQPVNLTLFATPETPWTIQRALQIAGPWTNLTPVVLPGPSGLASFQDLTPPPSNAFYRAWQP